MAISNFTYLFTQKGIDWLDELYGEFATQMNPD